MPRPKKAKSKKYRFRVARGQHWESKEVGLVKQGEVVETDNDLSKLNGAGGATPKFIRLYDDHEEAPNNSVESDEGEGTGGHGGQGGAGGGE